MAELLVIRHDKTPGFTPGDVIVVKPDGWKWSDRELFGESFVVIKRPDLSESEAISLYLPDAVPEELRAAEAVEWKRCADEKAAALAAIEPQLDAVRRATARTAEAAFDTDTLLVDPLSPAEKAVLGPAQQKALAVDRIAEKAVAAVVEDAVSEIVFDGTKLVPRGVYPQRLRGIDLESLAALGDKATLLDVDLATATRKVP